MSSGPSSDEQLIQAILSATDIVTMEPSGIDDASQSTRSPSLYDLHLPKQLQLRMLQLGISSSNVYVPEGDSSTPAQLAGSEEDRFLKRLWQQPAILELLRGPRGVNLRQQWSAQLNLLIAIDCIDEESVVFAENTVSMVIADLLALVVVDLSDIQFEHMGRWRLLSPYSSREKETKADLLFGLHLEDTIKQFDVKLSSLEGYKAIWPLVENLNPTYMRCITSMECKNIALGDPRGYLMLLLLTRLMTDGKVREFWPRLDCSGCQEFAESHAALARDAASVQIPDDDPGRELGIIPTTNPVVFRAEFNRLLALIPPNTITANASDSKKTVGPPRNQSPWYNTVYKEMKQLLIDLGHSDPRELNAIMHWATPIRNIMIQNWSQMVRHNLTLSTVTHFTKSFGVRRDREAGCATISSPDSADSRGYLLRRVARNLDAWMDALARSQIEQVPWVDIYRKSKKTTFVYHSASEESDDSKDDNQGNDSAGPRGGAGAGGNSGSGSSGQGRSSGGGSSNARTKRSLKPTYSQGDNKRPRQHSDFQVVLNRLHLAFNCPGEQLLSDGFSHYFFIPTAESSTGNPLSIIDHAGVILDTKVHQSTIGIVWAGKMYLEGLASVPKPLRIVVKLADWERDSEAPEGSETLHGKALRSEAKIYHHLVGSNIGPHFYGVFNNSGSIALVLEYMGKRLSNFGTLTDDSKHKLYDQVCNLHALGVQHNDLAPRNILINKEEDLTIIDFHQSELGHQCKGSGRCSELRDFAEQLRIVV
ncbi:hypothetical protein HHX47_DHR3000095 [Lentinula edodes]|nr:hypothetical protein HHX47_DHR3000095 [Lentinula edodes]